MASDILYGKKTIYIARKQTAAATRWSDLFDYHGRVFVHGAICRRINPSYGGPIELFLIPASAPRLV